MKIMSSLVLALIAIFSVLTSAKITPVGFKMIANVAQPSVATSEFQSNNDDVGGRQGQVAFFFPGHFHASSLAYQDLDCTTAISVGNSSKFVIKRSTVSRSNDPSGFTRVNHDLSFQPGEILGRFKTACSFLAPEIPRDAGVTAHASVAVGPMTAIMAENNTVIRPFNSVIGSFATYINADSTSFRLDGIDNTSTSNEFIIRNPTAHEATTGSTVNFTTPSNTVSCDGYWDGISHDDVAKASVIEGGNGIRFVFRFPLNSVRSMFFFCYGLRGSVHADGFPDKDARFFPTVLELAYDGIYKTYAVASTPSYPPPAEFKTGFTSNSRVIPFPHLLHSVGLE